MKQARGENLHRTMESIRRSGAGGVHKDQMVKSDPKQTRRRHRREEAKARRGEYD